MPETEISYNPKTDVIKKYKYKLVENSKIKKDPLSRYVFDKTNKAINNWLA